MVNHPNRKKAEEKAVLITTEKRGVFFGYTTDTSGDTINLRAARNCIQWRGLRGFLALASQGPTDQCRVGPAADLEVRGITSVAACTPEAVAAWESAPWRK